MSIFKFGRYETELDFTDVDFQVQLEEAYQDLQEDVRRLPKEGKMSDIMLAQVECYDRFLGKCLGRDAIEKMFETRSLQMRMDALEQLADVRAEAENALSERVSRYAVNKQGNREQRRAEKNQPGKKRNHGSRQDMRMVQ